ncbi:MAG: DegT/DnrJ/EryC1/StrS family aminotransferase, partial [Acidobacteria bacterium]|nr:DegT/DnrJ/EryC1/StrS family aminotransferase [Acidobacteriota bacterium]
KQITTGEGGMLVTDDDDLAALARSLRNQGRGTMGAWLEHPRMGYNYRLDEMSSALGRSQLKRLPRFLAERQKVADLYALRLGSIPRLRTPVVRAEVKISWFVYVVTLPHGVDRERLIRQLAEKGIPTRAYFSPIHRQPFARELAPAGGLPVTEDVAARTLALPFHNHLSADEVDRVGTALEEALGA